MIATSTIAYAEARAGFARKQREGLLTAEELQRTVAELDYDWRTYARLDVSNRLSLRGYDAVHLGERRPAFGEIR